MDPVIIGGVAALVVVITISAVVYYYLVVKKVDAKPDTTPVPKPVATTVKPVTQPSSQPVTQPVTQPVSQPTQPVTNTQPVIAPFVFSGSTEITKTLPGLSYIQSSPPWTYALDKILITVNGKLLSDDGTLSSSVPSSGTLLPIFSKLFDSKPGFVLKSANKGKFFGAMFGAVQMPKLYDAEPVDMTNSSRFDLVGPNKNNLTLLKYDSSGKTLNLGLALDVNNKLVFDNTNSSSGQAAIVQFWTYADFSKL